MNLTRISRAYAHVTLTATTHDGQAVAVATVDVALLPIGATPTVATAWATRAVVGNQLTVLLAGPEAPDDAALTVPLGGANLWGRVTDNPETIVANIGRVNII